MPSTPHLLRQQLVAPIANKHGVEIFLLNTEQISDVFDSTKYQTILDKKCPGFSEETEKKQSPTKVGLTSCSSGSSRLQRRLDKTKNRN